jgi:hypothetical protein
MKTEIACHFLRTTLQYQISWKSLQPFLTCYMRANGRCDFNMRLAEIEANPNYFQLRRCLCRFYTFLSSGTEMQ